VRERKGAGRADLERTLYRIGNAGLEDPETVLGELAALRGSWWYDGSGAETAEAVISELELARGCLGG
jgi:hypothetical protein